MNKFKITKIGIVDSGYYCPYDAPGGGWSGGFPLFEIKHGKEFAVLIPERGNLYPLGENPGNEYLWVKVRGARQPSYAMLRRWLDVINRTPFERRIESSMMVCLPYFNISLPDVQAARDRYLNRLRLKSKRKNSKWRKQNVYFGS